MKSRVRWHRMEKSAFTWRRGRLPIPMESWLRKRSPNDQGGIMSEQFRHVVRYSLSAGLLAGFLSVGIAPALTQQGRPDFSANNAGWVSAGGEWIPLPDSPPPVKQDSRYRYVPNNTGRQPTFRIADVSNPNLTQFAKDSLKKVNDEVLAGKPM